ncbi:SDR family oxidoreductase [Nocardia callitridis]|uniref:SDR family oxidoreductase n=1 Tax=Nocardia callitridis TaxID=648753 RepID=A0ABP9KSY1_9NOCA
MPATEASGARSPVTVVTGGGSGIGRATGIALARIGHHVVFCGRTRAALEESVGLAGSGAIAVLDVTDEAAVELFFGGLVDQLGRIDTLINSAGVFGVQQPVTHTTLADWSQTMTVNVTGTFLCARTAMRSMAAQSPRGGRIVNIGSVSAQTPRPHAAAYTASKHAITGLTRSLALDGRDLDIAVGQIDVGNASTSMTAVHEVGALQPDGTRRAEPTIDVAHVASTIAHIVTLPTSVSVPFLTIMATGMPFMGRG